MGHLYTIEKYIFSIFFFLITVFTAHTQTLELRQQIYSSHTGTPFYWGTDGGGHSIDYDGTQLIYGSPYGYYQNFGYFGGAITILEKAEAGWTEVAWFDAPGFTTLGMDVAIDNEWAFAGAPYFGKLYIFKKVNGTWTEHQIIDKSAIDKDFGNDISYSNGRLVASMVGSAFIYENVNDQWVETAHILPPAGSSGDFGQSVSIDNDNLVIGDAFATPTSTTRGRVSYYQYINNNWTLQQQISCPTYGEGFGYSVAIDGNTLAIGEFLTDQDGAIDVGQVHMYSKNGNTWDFDVILQPLPPVVNNYHFGDINCISIDNNTMVIGHLGNGPDRAHVYKKEAGNWVLHPDMTYLPNTDLWFYGGGICVYGDEYFIGSASLTDPNAPSNMNDLGGILYWTPPANISNIATGDITCMGDNITFDVSFDIENPLGAIEIYDTDNDVVLASGLTSPISVTMPGVATESTLNFAVRLANDHSVSDNASITLLPCCTLEETILFGQCNNNSTPDDGTDDTFMVSFSATNTSSSATQYNLVVQGTTYGPFDYGTGANITGLPANFSDIPFVFTDVDNPTCSVTRIIHSLPCSGCADMPVHISGNSPVCEGGNIILTEDGGYAGTWQWSGPNGFSYNGYNAIIPAATLADAGTYSVTITNPLGCTAVASVDVEVNPALLSVDAGTYDDVCENGGLVPLIGTPSGGVFSGPGVTGNYFDPSVAGLGTHYINYSVLDNCTGNNIDDYSPITVSPVTGSAPVVYDITTCEGGSTEIQPAGSIPQQQGFFTENFDENGVGVTGPGPVYTPPSNNRWSLSGNFSKLTNANRYFKVTNQSLTAKNTKRKICFRSQDVDISGKQNVGFSIDISEDGDLEPHDFVDVYYIIDGVSTKIPNWQGQGNKKHTLAGKNGANDDDWGATTIHVEGLSGNQLAIKVCVRNNKPNEDIHLDHLTINYLPYPKQFYFYDADPNSGNANLLAGPTPTYDPMTTPANSPQTIWVTRDITNGCQSPASPVVITVGENPISTAGFSSYCTGETITLSENTNIPGSQWTWTGPNGFSATTQDISIPNASLSESGTYTVLVSTPLGCTSTSSYYVNVIEGAPVPVLTDINVCESNSNTISIIYPDNPNGNSYSAEVDEVGAGATGPNATYTPPSDNSWSLFGPGLSKLTKANRYFKVINPGEIEVRNIRKKICMQSTTVDITEYKGGFEVNLLAGGNHKPGDYVDVFYIVDGVKTRVPNYQGQGNANHTLVGKNGSPDWTNANISMQDIYGSSLTVQVCVKLQGASKTIVIDYFDVHRERPQDYYFYDADPASGNATLLAGPSKSYNPNTTPATSPQTIWVSSVLNGCESAAVPTTITINARPVASILANTETPCNNQSLMLSETSGVATTWSWSGPNGFTSTEQNPTITNMTSASSGLYSVVASNGADCSSTDSIDIQVLPGNIEEVPCFDLIIPTAGHSIDFSPKAYNFYDADPTTGNATLLASNQSSFNFSANDVIWMTAGTPGGCESAPQQVIVNDPTDIYPYNAFGQTYSDVLADFTYTGDVIYPSFSRLAYQVDQTNEIQIFATFDDAINNANPLVYPYAVTADQYVFYRKGDPQCPTIGMAHLIPATQGKVSTTSPVAGTQKLSSEKQEMDNDEDIDIQEMELQQNYPNPFSNQTIIGFILPKADKATLTIYDTSGKIVHQSIKNYPKGQNWISMDASNWGESGILYYRLQTSKQSSIKKMLRIN